MSDDIIFTPLRFRNLTVKNRIFRSSISGRFDNEDGSLTQTRINWDVQAPVTGASVALFYSAGMVFAVSAAALLIRELVRMIFGQATEQDLLTVQGSEESAHLDGLRVDGSSASKEPPERA